jgi:hypothetical protein
MLVGNGRSESCPLHVYYTQNAKHLWEETDVTKSGSRSSIRDQNKQETKLRKGGSYSDKQQARSVTKIIKWTFAVMQGSSIYSQKGGPHRHQ